MDGAALLPWLEPVLLQALRSVRGHALLLHGAPGVGQFELGLAIATAWLCEAPAAQRADGCACGHCTGCKLVAARTHPDLLVVLPEALQEPLGWRTADDGDGDGKASKAKPSREIKVDAVRAVVAFAQTSASRGGAKVAVLHPAERMNGTSANTLLKTLEEPAGGARFILGSAQPERLLPTVRSRCQALRVDLPAAPLALAWMAQRQIDRPEILLAAAGGQPLEAVDRLGLGIDAQAWLRVARDVPTGLSQGLAPWPLPVVIDALQKLCHDVLCVAIGAGPRFFPASALPAAGDIERLTAHAAVLRRAARQAEHPWNAGLAVEALVSSTARALQTPAAAHAGGPNPLATLDR